MRLQKLAQWLRLTSVSAICRRLLPTPVCPLFVVVVVYIPAAKYHWLSRCKTEDKSAEMMNRCVHAASAVGVDAPASRTTTGCVIAAAR